MKCFSIVAVIFILIIVYYMTSLWYKFGLMSEANLLGIYGGGYVIITGASSGQGRQFALGLASRGFDICIIGSKRSYNVKKEIETMNRKCTVFERDLRKPWDDEFDGLIRDFVYSHNVSGLINNVGHRVGWFPYHLMLGKLIDDTVSCGIYPMVHLTRVVLPKLLERDRSFLIFVTAQCVYPGGSITVPGLAAYEATNAFGHHYAESIIREYDYRSNLDILNVTPGAVITSNTKNSLANTTFAVTEEHFVSNILKFLGGNIPNGAVCGDWKHEISIDIFAPLFPPILEDSTRQAGISIATEYMDKYRSRSVRSYP